MSLQPPRLPPPGAALPAARAASRPPLPRVVLQGQAMRVTNHQAAPLTGHALRNAHLRERSLARAQTAPPLARTLVEIRAQTLGMTRLEFARRSGISRGTLRDLELGIHSPTRRTLQQL